MPTEKAVWHRQDIIAELRKKGTPLAELARRHKFARCTMSWALMKPHERAQAAISAALDVPLHELWPAWYGPDGAPLWRMTRTPKPKPARPRARPRASRPAPSHSAQTEPRESSGRAARVSKTA